MRVRSFAACVTCVSALPALLSAQGLWPQVDPQPLPPSAPFLRLDLPKGQSSHPALAAGLEEWHEVWRPVCSSDFALWTQAELTALAARHKALMRSSPISVIDGPGEDAALNLVFNVTGSIPSGATAAIAATEAYLEGFFANENATVTINLSFQVMASNILGGTSSTYGYLTYADSRATLVGGMDGSDTIQGFLPTTSTLPVRYNGNSSGVTNENRVFWTFANFRANGGAVSGVDANMTFNSNFTWDFDPSNGVTGGTYSFRDVLVHEVGHALGFTSGGDFRVNDLEVLDLFRFQRTDGSGDYNPDTTAEFQARARLVDYNTPNDNHNTDVIASEFRMSDGSPYQMSHFREQASPYIGLMDPAFAAGETHQPNYLQFADDVMFDAIGYNR